jgi:hypothetical protein
MSRIIAVLVLAGVLLGGVATFGPMPRASAQVSDQGTNHMAPIQGEVTQKFTADDSNGGFTIAVNGQPVQVPQWLYDRVDVGTVVQFDGTHWSIISGGI